MIEIVLGRVLNRYKSDISHQQLVGLRRKEMLRNRQQRVTARAQLERIRTKDKTGCTEKWHLHVAELHQNPSHCTIQMQKSDFSLCSSHRSSCCCSLLYVQLSGQVYWNFYYPLEPGSQWTFPCCSTEHSWCDQWSFFNHFFSLKGAAVQVFLWTESLLGCAVIFCNPFKQQTKSTCQVLLQNTASSRTSTTMLLIGSCELMNLRMGFKNC